MAMDFPDDAPPDAQEQGDREAPEEPADVVLEPDPVWELEPQDVMVQLEYEPSFAAVLARNPFHVDGRIPGFTMYVDGTIIYRRRDRHGVWVTRDHRRLAERTIQHFEALGIGDMESHESSCRPTATGQSCISDSSIVVLRVRLDGELRELRNYNGIALEKEAELHAIYDRVRLLSRASPFGERAYVPQRATLWVSETGVDHAQARTPLPWPLSGERLPAPRAQESTKLQLEGEELTAALEVFGSHTLHPLYFVHGDRAFVAELVPWLPGMDHTDAGAPED